VELGAGEEIPLFLPTPTFMATADDDSRAGLVSLCSFHLLGSCFLLKSVRCDSHLLGTGLRAKGSLQRASTARTVNGKSG